MSTINGTFFRKDADNDAQPLNGATVKVHRATTAFLAALATNPPQKGTAVPVSPAADYSTTTAVSAGGEGAYRITGVTPGGYWLSFEYSTDPVVWEYHRAQNEDVINPIEYGATGLGTADDAPAIREALTAAAGRHLHFTAGTYLVGSYGTTDAVLESYYAFNIESNTLITADPGAIIKAADGYINSGAIATYNGASFFLAKNKNNVILRGLTFNWNGANNLCPSGKSRQGFAFYGHNTTNSVVEDVTVIDNPGKNGIVFGGGGTGSNNIVRNCVLRNGGTSIAANTGQVDYSAIYIDSTDSIVEGCRITHDTYPFTYSGGVEIHGARSVMRNCYVEKSGTGMYIASDAGGAYLDSIRVAGNQFDNVHNAVAFAGTGHFRGVDISNNIFHMKDNVNIAGSNAWAIHQAYDSTNTVQNILKNSQISNNICSSEAGSSGTLAFLNSINGLSITGNISIAPDDPPINIIGSPGGVTNLSITNNTLLNYCNVDATAKVAIQVNVTIRGAAGPYALNGLYVSGNIIHRDTLGSGFRAFYLEKATSSMTNVSIGPNTIINTNTVADGDYAATALPPFTQTYSTASKTHSNPTATALTAAFGTVDGTMEDAGATYNQTAVNNNFQEAATKINALIVDVANVKQVLNAQIDEAQVDRQVV